MDPNAPVFIPKKKQIKYNQIKKIVAPIPIYVNKLPAWFLESEYK